MGYRTYNTNDSGTVISGSDEIDLASEFLLLGSAYRVYQRRKTTTSTFAGVKLGDAQSLIGANSTATIGNFKVTATDSTGASSWNTVMGVCGTKSRASYNRIGESNLFTVTVEATTMGASSDGGATWDWNGNT